MTIFCRRRPCQPGRAVSFDVQRRDLLRRLPIRPLDLHGRLHCLHIGSHDAPFHQGNTENKNLIFRKRANETSDVDVGGPHLTRRTHGLVHSRAHPWALPRLHGCFARVHVHAHCRERLWILRPTDLLFPRAGWGKSSGLDADRIPTFAKEAGHGEADAVVCPRVACVHGAVPRIQRDATARLGNTVLGHGTIVTRPRKWRVDVIWYVFPLRLLLQLPN